MIIEKTGLIYARDFYDGDDDVSNESWKWARWTLFVIFILAIVMFIVGVVGLNRRRKQVGRAPIRGTAWITPPSYRQSQRDHDRREDSEFVPQYTAKANENDLGYYDENGEFHLNSKGEFYPPPSSPPPNETSEEPRSNSSMSLTRPENAVTRDRHNSSDVEAEFDRDFGRGRPHTETLYTAATNNSSSVEKQHISTPERAKMAES
ncbi:hypothetical protein ZYGR_0A02050 [Zygosaccharomyces rouxii]|uniref:ZYRO0A04664p n=2 Tax=Zygosaccharomyces rouxii TaxID=4956 RepID=C5DPM9_ZYGRC|nr:uncharacterized protein ZYRO0A04664g [Zygosaccharomyces rouxii]KAH9198840.1 chitin synthesis regulation, resistance to congo red-domain-containing protein [Zygosaccharomyces rouxii]GAV46612.1 hypothetical protein ZYGR_0A02050 [Zygosaccharomyces rouxii]CAR25640.1 ZYRO0A04664p [Zygosaccharomyces rouxii]